MKREFTLAYVEVHDTKGAAAANLWAAAQISILDNNIAVECPIEIAIAVTMVN